MLSLLREWHDLIYFSASAAVEEEFERRLLQTSIKVEFMGDVDCCLGTSFNWDTSPDGHVSVHISQYAFAEAWLRQLQFDADCATNYAPMQNGHFWINICGSMFSGDSNTACSIPFLLFLRCFCSEIKCLFGPDGGKVVPL